jgi:hypothetical protein
MIKCIKFGFRQKISNLNKKNLLFIFLSNKKTVSVFENKLI